MLSEREMKDRGLNINPSLLKNQKQVTPCRNPVSTLRNSALLKEIGSPPAPVAESQLTPRSPATLEVK